MPLSRWGVKEERGWGGGGEEQTDFLLSIQKQIFGGGGRGRHP